MGIDPFRCSICSAPAVVREGLASVPHATWCRWAPRPRPPVVTLTAPAAVHDSIHSVDATERRESQSHGH